MGTLRSVVDLFQGPRLDFQIRRGSLPGRTLALLDLMIVGVRILGQALGHVQVQNGLAQDILRPCPGKKIFDRRFVAVKRRPEPRIQDESISPF